MRRLLTALVALAALPASAGYFELSGNGSYYKYNNGIVAGESSSTSVVRWGAGLAYRFMANAAIEFKYTHSKNTDIFAQISETEGRIYRLNRLTEFDNYSVGLNLDFADRKAAFRPFVSGGIGYMIRKQSLNGTYEETLFPGVQNELEFTDAEDVKSLSADAGIGFKIFVAESVAIEASASVFATDLDKPEIYLHYSAAGGLRFVF